MSLRIISASFIAVCSLFVFAGSAVAACEPDGEVQFVCGPISPEDLLVIPDTPWVVTSGYEAEGYLYLVDTRDHSYREVFPVASAKAEPDTSTYGACRDLPSTQFQAHGLGLRPGANGKHTLYVVAHGGREAVEVFNLDASGSVPELTWIGCVEAPDGVSLNSVAPLLETDNDFIATNLNISAGQSWEWSPATGWAQVPGSEMPGPNGIVVSPDGRWLYVGGWMDGSLMRLSRGQDPVRKDVIKVGFHVDNVHWAPDGSLLVAGQYFEDMASAGKCMGGGECDGVSSRVVRVDPDELTIEQVIDYPSNDFFIFGTAAIEVGEEIWFGGIAGGDRIGRFPL
ncbi:MAG: hypothetical protein JKY98_06225 [Gammaproteobacteria bacterium]|nr:hypothetical protein [Gammaproteobacteria bacterium]